MFNFKPTQGYVQFREAFIAKNDREPTPEDVSAFFQYRDKQVDAQRTLKYKEAKWATPYKARHTRRKEPALPNWCDAAHVTINKIIKTLATDEVEAVSLIQQHINEYGRTVATVKVENIKNARLTGIVDALIRDSQRGENGVWRPIPYEVLREMHHALGRKLDEEPYKALAKLFTVHRLHLSEQDHTMIAFTESVDKLIADRQTRMKFGRYLMRFYGPGAQHPCMTEDECKKLNEAFIKETCPAELLHATTKKEFVRVINEGPGESCMSAGFDDRDMAWYRGHVHPAYAYNEEDFEVLYIERDGEITARAITNKKDKKIARVYGDKARLMAAAEACGYVQENGALEGLRLDVIENRNGRGYIMPYVDAGTASGGGALNAVKQGDYWVLTSDSDEGVDTYAGYNNQGIVYDEGDRGDYEDEEDTSYCDECENSVPSDDVREAYFINAYGLSSRCVCESCIEDSYQRARVRLHGRSTEVYAHEDDVIECQSNGEMYVNDADTLEHFEIEQCAYSDDYYKTEDLVCIDTGDHGGDYVQVSYAAQDYATGEWILKEDAVKTDEGWIANEYAEECMISGDTIHSHHAYEIKVVNGTRGSSLKYVLAETLIEDPSQILEMFRTDGAGNILLPEQGGQRITVSFNALNVYEGEEVSEPFGDLLDEALEQVAKAA